MITLLNEPRIECPYKIDWRVKVGDFVHIRFLVDIAGIITFENNDREVLRSDFNKLRNWSPVTCE